MSIPGINNGYILDLYASSESGRGMDRLYFTYIPDQFDESKDSHYAHIDILGRSEPIQGYLGSGPRCFNITIPIPLDAVGVSNSIQDLIYQKNQKINFLRSLAYPDYNPASRLMRPPPPILIVFGSFFVIRGVAQGFRMNHRAPYEPNTLTPYFTDCSLLIEETATIPWSNLDIKSGMMAIPPTQ